MNKCERLLDDAVTAHDESLAKEHEERLALVRETFDRIFPDWDKDCVEIDDKGVSFKSGIYLMLRHSYIDGVHCFGYARRGGHWTSHHSVHVTSLADFGRVVKLHRESVEEGQAIREKNARIVKALNAADYARLNARNAAISAYEKKGWLGRLLSKRPGYGVER